MLPALLPVAPVTTRFAITRSRLAHGGWKPSYKLSSGRLWWRCLRLTASRGQLHPCAERLAKHLSWHLDDRCTLTNIRALLGSYAVYHHLSLRTAWTDWSRLVAAGWLAPTRAPANQGPNRPQGPGSGRAARYTLTAPTKVIRQLRSRSCQLVVTALDSFSLEEASPSPSVPPRKLDPLKGWITLQDPTPTKRRDASALLAGCHELWRRQRPDNDLLTRPDWHQLLLLVAKVQHQRPDVALTAVLTDRVASACCLPGVLAWRLWQLLHQPQPQETRSEGPLGQPALQVHNTTLEETDDWQQHLTAVRTIGGPAAVRAALHTARSRPTG